VNWPASTNCTRNCSSSRVGRSSGLGVADELHTSRCRPRRSPILQRSMISRRDCRNSAERRISRDGDGHRSSRSATRVPERERTARRIFHCWAAWQRPKKSSAEQPVLTELPLQPRQTGSGLPTANPTAVVIFPPQHLSAQHPTPTPPCVPSQRFTACRCPSPGRGVRRRTPRVWQRGSGLGELVASPLRQAGRQR
jgi:hypothetical protein